MEALKRLPIGMQSFEDIRKKDFLYVDKTDLVYELATGGSKYYFLSRPRRFGKSLLLSTLHAYFDGRKDLFEGLAIEQLEKGWVKYPVLHVDLNTGAYTTPEALKNKLSTQLLYWEEIYGKNDGIIELGDRFEGVIRRAYEQTGQQVVILVDEYDKPMLEAIADEQLQESYRSILKGFYGALKSMDVYIRFAFLTGVTKFSKVNIFSGLNNIRDISMNECYVGICGITDEEIDVVLTPYVTRLATKLGITVNETREELRSRYDGYHFCENTVGIYNPYSLLNTFEDNKFRNYWFETGTPSYLVYLLKKHNYQLEKLTTTRVKDSALTSSDYRLNDPIPVIYQSGYLTITGYDPQYNLYKLGFPNKEVEDGFFDFLLPYYSSITESESGFFIANFVEEVKAGKVEEFLKRLSSLFADTPYELVKELENHYQNVIFIVSKLLGFYVKAEYHTSEGSIDLVLQAPDYTYVMEFKFNGTAEEALAQINDKQYALPFECDNRHLIKVGVNFSSKTRNIDSWKIGQSSK
jgi:hypothetical protein